MGAVRYHALWGGGPRRGEKGEESSTTNFPCGVRVGSASTKVKRIFLIH